MGEPVFDKGLVLPDKLIHLSKTRVSNAPLLPECGGGGRWAPLELIDALFLGVVHFREVHWGSLWTGSVFCPSQKNYIEIL